jgi:hypothetical protein
MTTMIQLYDAWHAWPCLYLEKKLSAYLGTFALLATMTYNYRIEF